MYNIEIHGMTRQLLGEEGLKDSKANHEEESPEASVSLKLTTTTRDLKTENNY